LIIFDEKIKQSNLHIALYKEVSFSLSLSFSNTMISSFLVNSLLIDLEISALNTTDASAIFLTKLTDTPIANSDYDQQLIHANKNHRQIKSFKINKRNARDKERNVRSKR
jgi:hypothetical protein